MLLWKKHPLTACILFRLTVASSKTDKELYVSVEHKVARYLYILYKCNPLRVINSYFSHMWWSHIIILFAPLDLNETPYPGLPQPTKSSYLFTWFYYCHMMELATKHQKNNVCANIPHSFLSHPFLTFYYTTTVMWITMVENP